MGMQAGVNAAADATTGVKQHPFPRVSLGNMVRGQRIWPRIHRFCRFGELARNIDDWRTTARAKISELLSSPSKVEATGVQTLSHEQFDGLDVEHISWQLPYGRATQAVLLKPQGATGPLPAVLGLHDHGGNKYLRAPQDHTHLAGTTPVDSRTPDGILRWAGVGQ